MSKSRDESYRRDPSQTRANIAVIQMTSTGNKKRNLEVVASLIKQAVKESSSEMIFFPEATDYIASTNEILLSQAETIAGPTVQAFRNMAQSNKVWLQIGVHEKADGSVTNSKIYNTSIIISSTGKIVGAYRKLHLFDVSVPERNIDIRESNILFSGAELVGPISTPVGNIGMLICYDLRFPEVSTALRQMNAEILTYPSAFTTHTGRAHWQFLLKARAIENQCYVLAAAQVGKHDGKRESYGHAMIIDPWGNVQSAAPNSSDEKSSEPHILTGTIDFTLLKNVRANMPVFTHRRGDLYTITIRNNALSFPNSDLEFADKKIPAGLIFFRTKYSFAFTNSRSIAPGHVLVAPYRITKKLTDLNDDEIEDLFLAVTRIQRVMEKIHNVSASTVTIQDGEDAGNNIPHVHCHVVPRKKGDFNKNNNMYMMLDAFGTAAAEIPLRSRESLVAEAEEIKKALKNIDEIRNKVRFSQSHTYI